MSIQIREMRSEDGRRVLAIYEQGIATGHATFETAVPAWEQWDQAHLTHCRLVAITDDEVAGWAALSLVSRRAVYRGVAEVSVYVATERQGLGIGKQLLQALVETSEEAGIWTLQASIFPENEASVNLHLRCGFRLVGHREKIAQHGGRWRDTLLLERHSQRVSRQNEVLNYRED